MMILRDIDKTYRMKRVKSCLLDNMNQQDIQSLNPASDNRIQLSSRLMQIQLKQNNSYQAYYTWYRHPSMKLAGGKHIRHHSQLSSQTTNYLNVNQKIFIYFCKRISTTIGPIDEIGTYMSGQCRMERHINIE